MYSSFQSEPVRSNRLGFRETAKRLDAAHRKKHEREALKLRKKLEQHKTERRKTQRGKTVALNDDGEPVDNADNLEDDGVMDEDDDEMMFSSVEQRWGLIAQRLVKARLASRKPPERWEHWVGPCLMLHLFVKHHPHLRTFLLAPKDDMHVPAMAQGAGTSGLAFFAALFFAGAGEPERP